MTASQFMAMIRRAKLKVIKGGKPMTKKPEAANENGKKVISHLHSLKKRSKGSLPD